MTGLALTVSRSVMGLTIAALVTIAATMVIAPRVDRGAVRNALGVVLGTAVAAAATGIVVWTAGLAVASGLLALRWTTVAPSRIILAAGRTVGLGCAAAVAAAPFLPVAESARGPASILAGALLGGFFGSMMALIPVGGWAITAGRQLCAGDFVPWAAAVVPTAMLTAVAVGGQLPAPTMAMFSSVLLVAGLTTTVWHGVHGLRTDARGRYGRLFGADLGLIAVAIGTRQHDAVLGAFVVFLGHLVAMPVLLNPPAAGLRRPRRMLWAMLAGIPPAPAFWGRLLILDGCAAIGPEPLTAALVATGLLVLVGMVGVLERDASGRDGAVSRSRARAAAWSLAGVGWGAGLAPMLALRLWLGAV